MTRIKIAATGLAGLAGLVAVSACTAVDGAPPMASEFAAASVSAAPRVERAAQPAGFEIDGAGFSARFTYAQSDGRPVAHLVHSNGAQRLEAELDPVMPWMGDGLRRFAGQDERGAPAQASFAAGVCKRGDEVFSHRVELRLGERRYRGCARETGRALPWSADLPALMSPIEACVRDSARSAIAHVRGAAARRVAHARRDGGGTVVRLSYPGGARFDCAVTPGGRVTWRVVGPNEPLLPSEADPVFAPAFASGTAPRDGQGCYIYEHVHDAQGRVVGALGHDACAVGAPDTTG